MKITSILLLVNNTYNNYSVVLLLVYFRINVQLVFKKSFTIHSIESLGWDQNKLYNGFSLPSPRKVSTDLISSSKTTADDEISHMVMQWGQFLGEIELHLQKYFFMFLLEF